MGQKINLIRFKKCYILKSTFFIQKIDDNQEILSQTLYGHTTYSECTEKTLYKMNN